MSEITTIKQITNYLRQHGWEPFGERHWYHEGRSKSALDYSWAVYYEIKENPTETLNYLNGLKTLPTSIEWMAKEVNNGS